MLEAPNYVHLATLRADGSPRSWSSESGLDGDCILVCTCDQVGKTKDMSRDPRVAMSVTDQANQYRMAAILGQVTEIRPNEGCRYLDPISWLPGARSLSRVACVIGEAATSALPRAVPRAGVRVPPLLGRHCRSRLRRRRCR